MDYNIAVMAGDGIGPEIVKEAIKVLDKVGELSGNNFKYTDVLGGGIAIDQTGNPMPDESIEICKKSDAVLLGAVGGPKWDDLPGHLRAEAGLLKIRKELGLFANLRPAVVYNALKDATPLKPEIIGDSLDLLVVRELTGGIYFGKKGRSEDGLSAYDTEEYSVMEIERIAKVAFETARTRNNLVTNIDKMNVMESGRLWRETVLKLHEAEYSDVKLNHLLVDNAAMQLVRDPKQFDVMLTNNIFGDILSDQASMLTGSIGLLPSASLADGKFGLYEPSHGSAPDIAGQDKANPLATILSISMMLKYSFDLEKESEAVEKAVEAVLDAGYRTGDIYTDGDKLVGCIEMGDLVAKHLKI